MSKQSRSPIRQASATVILTRPKSQSEQFAECLQQLSGQLEVVISPLLEIVELPANRKESSEGGVIFTSRNGVDHWVAGAGRPAFCVGEATTKHAQTSGWDAVMMGRTADELVSNLVDNGVKGPLLHVSGVHTRVDIAERLSNRGVRTKNVAAYDQRLLPLSRIALRALGGGNPVFVPLFSPRTARQFAKEVRGIAPVHIVALSDAVMDEVETLRIASKTVVCAPDQASMLEALRNLLRRVEAGRAPK